MYIAIAGNIGSGKSSLTKLLGERYALTPIFEAVDENPYLEDFYLDMKRFATSDVSSNCNVHINLKRRQKAKGKRRKEEWFLLLPFAF